MGGREGGGEGRGGDKRSLYNIHHSYRRDLVPYTCIIGGINNRLEGERS